MNASFLAAKKGSKEVSFSFNQTDPLLRTTARRKARYIRKEMRATANPAYLELIEFLAGGTTPEALIAFRPSQAVQKRVSNLLDREHEGQLTEDDKLELGDYLQLEHLMILAKAQARRKVQIGS